MSTAFFCKNYRQTTVENLTLSKAVLRIQHIYRGLTFSSAVSNLILRDKVLSVPLKFY